MSGREKIFGLLLVSVSVVVALVIAEGAFRVWLWFDANRPPVSDAGVTVPRDVSFVQFPGLWVFNREYGFDYRPEGMRFGRVKEGKFASCNIQTMNSRGNVATIDTDFKSAAVRIALVGSSYTMVAASDGRLFHETLGEHLSKALGRNVLVENFGRDSFGVAAMMDMAKVVARDYRPDLIVIAFNTATLAMNRHWRVVKLDADGSGYGKFYWVNEPESEKFTSHNSQIHEYVVTDKATVPWCDRMTAAARDGNGQALTDDRLVKGIIARFREIARQRETPRFVADLGAIRVSYLYNYVRRGNAFAGMEAYRKDAPLVPYPYRSFAEDERFVNSHRELEGSGVPYAYVHIPSYPEVKDNDEWASIGTIGISEDRARSLLASLPATTGKPILSLLPLLPSAAAGEAERLAVKALPPDTDWHPSAAGADLFAMAATELILPGLSRSAAGKTSE